MRIDKWLWAARLTKTRGLASEALKAGRVTINGAVAKPSREVKVGDRLEVRVGPTKRSLTIDGLSERRVSAALAANLFTEDAESIEARAEADQQRRLVRPKFDDSGARPTKRDRRRLDRDRDQLR
jgi:ribosome-associated heat shock protein Hsp15